MERWRQGDPMGWSEIAAPEVTYVDPGLARPLVGHDEYTRFLEALQGKIFYSASQCIEPKAAVYGDIAVLSFNYRRTTRRDDGTVREFVPWDTTEGYAKLDGRWRIVYTHRSLIGAQPPGFASEAG